MSPGKAEPHVIAGEGWRRAGIGTLAGAEGEDAQGAAELGLAEGGGFGFTEGAEFAGTGLDDGAGDFVNERSGLGAGALRERENVKIGEGEALDEGERGGVVVFG